MRNGKSILTILCVLFAFTFTQKSRAQSAWPGVQWSSATNLSAILPSSAEEISGLYWNQTMKRLLVTSDQGELFVLQMNATNGQFSLLNTSTKVKSTEAITQVNDQASEFYIINEAAYEINKFTHNYNFSTVTKVNSWNLLLSKSTMTNTDNDGPEGIAFVPDSYLSKIGFISAVTQNKYISTKGMNGLLFVAHQDKGYVWVFDVNPLVNDDYIFVGKYRTSRSESCELAFDTSTGLMYIMHNIDDNYIEITDLSTIYQFGEYYLKTKKEILLPAPPGSNNIEGLALAPKFPEENYAGLWLCRDVTKSDEKSSALAWFQNFPAEGDNLKTGITSPDDDVLSVMQTAEQWIIEARDADSGYRLVIYDIQGRQVFKAESNALHFIVDAGNFPAGLYIVQLSSDQYRGVKYKKIISHL